MNPTPIQIKMNTNHVYNQLIPIITAEWANYQKVKGMTCVVNDAIPILWFGDIASYVKSEKRIVTVGLNPSNNEFEDGTKRGVDVRFPKALPLVGKSILTPTDITLYTYALNEYFCVNPYMKWFKQYEQILNLLNASYFVNNCSRTAIHIDACSSIATDPTWGSLCSKSKMLLQSNNSFIPLMNALNPDIVLISANKQIVESYFGKNGWTDYNPGNTAYVRTKVHDNRIIIWGYNNHGTPFGGINITDPKKIINLKKIMINIRTYYNF